MSVQKGDRSRSKTPDCGQVEFEDDENFVSMQAMGQLSDNFPSDTEEGECSSDEVIVNSQSTHRSKSENRFRSRERHSATPSEYDSSDQNQSSESESNSSLVEESDQSEEQQNDRRDTSPEPTTSRGRAGRSTASSQNRKNRRGVDDTIQMMQNFMIQRGFIDEPMNETEMKEYLANAMEENNSNDNHKTRHSSNKKGRNHKGKEVGELLASPSEVTVYKDAVKLPSTAHNASASSDDSNNTSDDSVDKNGGKMDTLDDSVNLLSRISGVMGSRRSRSHTRSHSHKRSRT